MEVDLHDGPAALGDGDEALAQRQLLHGLGQGDLHRAVLHLGVVVVVS